MHRVALNAAHTIALAKLQGTLEISKCAAVELAINQGLFDLNVLSVEDYEIFDARYKRKLVDIIEEKKAKREDSHLPKLELEKQKQVQCQTSAQKQEETAKLSKVAAILRGMYEQLESHTDVTWRIKAVNLAKTYPDLEYAKLLTAKEKPCDIISQKSEAKESAI